MRLFSHFLRNTEGVVEGDWKKRKGKCSSIFLKLRPLDLFTRSDCCRELLYAAVCCYRMPYVPLFLTSNDYSFSQRNRTICFSYFRQHCIFSPMTLQSDAVSRDMYETRYPYTTQSSLNTKKTFVLGRECKTIHFKCCQFV